MGFGALRTMIRPLPRTLISRTSTCSMASFSSPSPSPNLNFQFQGQSPWILISRHFTIFSESNQYNYLTDTRFPKRRPLDKPRPKRAILRPPGPYAWVKHVPGQPIQSSNPNEGSVKRRNEKKRIKQHRAFIKAEAKKRKAQMQEAERKKIIKRVECKMAAVARDRAWAQRLVELQQLEEKKKYSA